MLAWLLQGGWRGLGASWHASCKRAGRMLISLWHAGWVHPWVQWGTVPRLLVPSPAKECAVRAAQTWACPRGQWD